MQMWWLMPLGLAIWKAEIGVLLDHKSLRPAWAIYRYSCLKKKKKQSSFQKKQNGQKNPEAECTGLQCTENPMQIRLKTEIYHVIQESGSR
jgi:hypothetical protein